MENGWSLKHLHRVILMSDTWRQDSRPLVEAMRIDAASRLLWRFPVRRLEAEGIRIVPLLETARSILEIPAIASAPRVAHMALGETDLAADLGMYPSPDGHEMDPIRMSIVVASAAEGLNRPIGPVQTAFRDLESLRSTSLMLRRMGYGGRAGVHPAQVPVINEAFAPTEDEILAAKDILERFKSAHSGGAAVTVAGDGSLIDEAVVRRARVTIAASRPDQEREL